MACVYYHPPGEERDTITQNDANCLPHCPADEVQLGAFFTQFHPPNRLTVGDARGRFTSRQYDVVDDVCMCVFVA